MPAPRMDMHLKWNCGQGAALAATLVLAALVPRVRRPPRAAAATTCREPTAISAPDCAPHSYLRNDVIFYDAGIGPRPINGGLDPGFEQKLWMDRLTLGGFTDSGILGAQSSASNCRSRTCSI